MYMSLSDIAMCGIILIVVVAIINAIHNGKGK